MNASSMLPVAAERPITLAGIAAMLHRRRTLLLWPPAVAIMLAALLCALAVPRYRATAEIQVRKDTGGSFGLESTVMGAQSTLGDSLDYTTTLQTEVGILKSPALALAVIKDADLEHTPDYFAPKKDSRPSWFVNLLPRSTLEPLAVLLKDAPNRRYEAEKIFKAHLKVTPQAGTRLIDIAYTDRDPERAARVANTITRALADISFQQHVTSAVQGSDWLVGQLTKLRGETEQAQARAVDLQKGRGMFGNDASRNVVLERLDSLNQTLTAAESNRILKESIDRVAAEASPELISSLSGNSSTGSVASINTSLSLIQGLRQQEAQVRAELAEDGMRYGPAYPKIAELQAQLSGIMTSIAAETRRLGQRAHTDWQIAVRQEQAARSDFEQQKVLAGRQNDKVLAYQLAREEADSSRDLYEGLQARLKQASLLKGLQANDISVVSAAETPSPQHPTSPSIPVCMAAALLGGLLLGFAAAVVRDMTDHAVRSLPELEALLGAPLLAVLPLLAAASLPRRRLLAPPRTASGSLPMLRPHPALPMLESRQAPFSEEMRSLRTELFAWHPQPGQTILVTSALPHEGKTTLAVNLAASLAQTGARVLLVDADLRRSTLRYYGEKLHSLGLATALSGPEAVPFQIPFPSLPNLSMLAGSDLPPCPAELLASPRTGQLVAEWRAAFDYVLFDSPPLLPVTDAALLSRHSDLTLLVARHNRTPAQALSRAVDILKRRGAAEVPVGVVLNGVPHKSGEFYHYFGHTGEFYV